MRIEGVSSAIFFVTLVALIWLVYSKVRSLRVDETRYRLFVVRDRLFVEAAERGLLDSAAHSIVRDTINGLIRFCHRFSLADFLVILFMARPENRDDRTSSFADEFDGSLSSIPQADRALFKNALLSSHAVLIAHLAKSTPILMPVYFVHWLLRRAGLLKAGRIERLIKVVKFRRLDSAALAEGRAADKSTSMVYVT